MWAGVFGAQRSPTAVSTVTAVSTAISIAMKSLGGGHRMRLPPSDDLFLRSAIVDDGRRVQQYGRGPGSLLSGVGPVGTKGCRTS